ncbi:hypothetical protein LguiB_014858 [Lonicera macranthoides]
MGADRVKIKGQIDPDKVLKKLKKKTGKRVEILVNNNNNDKHGEKDEDPNEKDGDDLGLGGVSSERYCLTASSLGSQDFCEPPGDLYEEELEDLYEKELDPSNFAA